MESVDTVFLEVPREKVQEILQAASGLKLCEGSMEVKNELQDLKMELSNSRTAFMKEIGTVSSKVLSFEKHIIQALHLLTGKGGKGDELHAQGKTPLAGKRKGSPCTPGSSPCRPIDLSSYGVEKIESNRQVVDAPKSKKGKRRKNDSIAEVGYVTGLDTYVVGPFRLMCQPDPAEEELVNFVFGSNLDPR